MLRIRADSSGVIRRLIHRKPRLRSTESGCAVDLHRIQAKYGRQQLCGDGDIGNSQRVDAHAVDIDALRKRQAIAVENGTARPLDFHLPPLLLLGDANEFLMLPDLEINEFGQDREAPKESYANQDANAARSFGIVHTLRGGDCLELPEQYFSHTPKCVKAARLVR